MNFLIRANYISKENKQILDWTKNKTVIKQR